MVWWSISNISRMTIIDIIKAEILVISELLKMILINFITNKARARATKDDNTWLLSRWFLETELAMANNMAARVGEARAAQFSLLKIGRVFLVLILLINLEAEYEMMIIATAAIIWYKKIGFDKFAKKFVAKEFAILFLSFIVSFFIYVIEV